MALEFPPDGKYPTREEAVELLKACDKNRENIEQWNEYRKNHGDWAPDISDEAHPADLRNLTLCYDDEENKGHGIDLSRAIVRGAKLSHAKLRGALLGKADLSGAELHVADLNGADLSQAILSGAKLKVANLREADLDGADLSGARLDGANLKNARMNGANLSDVNVTGVRYDRRSMTDKCRGIRVASCYGHAVFKRDAEDQDFIDERSGSLKALRAGIALTAKGAPVDSNWIGRWFGRWNHLKFRLRVRIIYALRLFRFWVWGLTDFGRSWEWVAGVALYLALGFGSIYNWFPDMLRFSGQSGELKPWCFTPYYYSIVTYTTLGFGDVTPVTTPGEIIVVVEVICGYVTLGLLVSILASQVARRS